MWVWVCKNVCGMCETQSMCVRKGGREAGQDQAYHLSGRWPNQSGYPGAVWERKRPTLAPENFLRPSAPPLAKASSALQQTRFGSPQWILVIQPGKNSLSQELTSSFLPHLPTARTSRKLPSGFDPHPRASGCWRPCPHCVGRAGPKGAWTGTKRFCSPGPAGRVADTPTSKGLSCDSPEPRGPNRTIFRGVL